MIIPNLWKQFAAQNGGLLVVGHGTRNTAGVQELISLVDAMRSELPADLPIEASFLELANPTIETAVEKLESSGCRQLLVIPILLFTAAHAREDIPEAVQKAIASKPIQIFGQSTALGTEEAALTLSETRFLTALKCSNPGGCLKAGGCEFANECISNNFGPNKLDLATSARIGLAMVGRGTSDAEAREHMLRLSQLRVTSSPVEISWSQTGFFAGGSPDVIQLLQAAEESDCDWIVVQPHLLFEGHLSEQLRQMVDQLRKNGSQKRWLVAQTLGADPLLASTFLALGRKVISTTNSN